MNTERKIKATNALEDVVWVVVQYVDDMVISGVLKGEDVELEDGSSAQEGNAYVGQACLAPWKKHLYDATIVAVSTNKEIVLKVKQQATAAAKKVTGGQKRGNPASEDKDSAKKRNVTAEKDKAKTESKKVKSVVVKEKVKGKKKPESLKDAEVRAEAQKTMFKSLMNEKTTVEVEIDVEEDMEVDESDEDLMQEYESENGEESDWQNDEVFNLKKENKQLLTENATLRWQITSLEEKVKKLSRKPAASANVLTPRKVKVLKDIVASTENRDNVKTSQRGFFNDKESKKDLQRHSLSQKRELKWSPTQHTLPEKDTKSYLKKTPPPKHQLPEDNMDLKQPSPQPEKDVKPDLKPLSPQHSLPVKNAHCKTAGSEEDAITSACQTLNLTPAYIKVLKLQYREPSKMLGGLMDKVWTKNTLAQSSIYGSRVAVNKKTCGQTSALAPLEFGAIKAIVYHFFPYVREPELHRVANAKCSSARRSIREAKKEPESREPRD